MERAWRELASACQAVRAIGASPLAVRLNGKPLEEATAMQEAPTTTAAVAATYPGPSDCKRPVPHSSKGPGDGSKCGGSDSAAVNAGKPRPIDMAIAATASATRPGTCIPDGGAPPVSIACAAVQTVSCKQQRKRSPPPEKRALAAAKGPKLLNGPSEPTEKRSKPAPGRIGKPSKRPREKGWVPSCADAEGPYDFLGLVLDAMRRNDDANADAAGGFSGSSSDSDRCPTPVLDQPSAGAANGKGADSEHRRATAPQAPATQARPAEHAYYKAKAVDVAPAYPNASASVKPAAAGAMPPPPISCSPQTAAAAATVSGSQRDSAGQGPAPPPPMWIRVLRPPSAGPAAAVGGEARRVEVEWRAGLGAVLGAASAALGERVVELWDGALNGVDDGAQLRPAGLYFAVTPADLARV
eukprot:tig00020688_g12989.t1